MKTENNIKIAFLGGDSRTVAAARILKEDRWDIFCWNVPGADEFSSLTVTDSIYKAISEAKAIILPLPTSLDGISLNCKIENNDTKPQLNLIADALDDGCIIIGGKLPKSFVGYTGAKGIKSYDYFESESFQIKNAYTTAEAALNIAMNNLSRNIKGAKIAVTGYGRISKQLVKLLNLLGAHVTLLARKESDLTFAQLDGCKTINLCDGKNEGGGVSQIANGYDIIFNTVPSWLFDEAFLRAMDKKTLIIDLASAPGGVDVSQAKRLKSNVLWAASLPGKYAPQSAGELICDCVKDIIKTEVVP